MESEEELQKLAKQSQMKAQASEERKVLETRVEVLRKEVTKTQGEFVALSCLLQDAPAASVSNMSTPTDGPGSVTPVVVLGQTWHCAVLRVDEEDNKGSKVVRHHLGPLRSDADSAARDLQLLLTNGECEDAPSKRQKNA